MPILVLQLPELPAAERADTCSLLQTEGRLVFAFVDREHIWADREQIGADRERIGADREQIGADREHWHIRVGKSRNWGNEINVM
jgi:hypothetical protein